MFILSATKDRHTQPRFNDGQHHKKTSEFFIREFKFIRQFTAWCRTFCSKFIQYGGKTWCAGAKLGSELGRRNESTTNKSYTISDVKYRGPTNGAKEKEIRKRGMARKETNTFILGVIGVVLMFFFASHGIQCFCFSWSVSLNYESKHIFV